MTDIQVFCTDVGWRKPAKQIFDHALHLCDLIADQCVFVGDDPRWDLEGSRAVGIKALIINRGSDIKSSEDVQLSTLRELLAHV